MKRWVQGLIMLTLLIVTIVTGYLFANGLIMSESRVINNQDVELSRKVKIEAYINGGYYKLYDKLLNKGLEAREAINYISEGLGDYYNDEASAYSVAPRDASVIFTSDYYNPFEYYQEILGKQVDMDRLYSSVAKSLDDNSEIEYRIIEAEPAITYAQLLNLTAKRGEFTTAYTYSSLSRKNNIKLAAEQLNGYVLEPNETMSFNDVVGPRTEERGFMSADIIYKGTMVPGIGGGVCQVSSTMYNACLLSGLKIIASSRHSRPIPYLAPSLDAMVSTISDLVICNVSDSPVFILTNTTDENISFAIYGEKLEYEYRLRSEIINTIPPKQDNIIVQGDNLSEGLKKLLAVKDSPLLKNFNYVDEVVIESRAGIISEAYLDRYKDNIIIDSELVSSDIYYPQQGEIFRTINY